MSELATEDTRATGGFIAHDPWSESGDEKILFRPINKPVLSLRSQDFDSTPMLREKIMGHISANSLNKGLLLSGSFKDSVHNSMMSMIMLIPRKLTFFKQVNKVEDVPF